MTAWPLSVSQWVTRAPTAAAAARITAAAGYGAIEQSADTSAPPAQLRRVVDAKGLQVTSLCAMYSLERDYAHPDPGPRRAAREYLKSSVALAGEVGAAVIVVVPTYRVDDDADRRAELGWAAETIAAVADGIAPGGPVLALEALNRYETHLLRTLGEADELRRMIDHPQVGLMADVFHMNIEEDDLPHALREHLPQVVHVHLADNQRREPGSGQLDLRGALAVLAEGGYDGRLAMEFLPATVSALSRGREHVEALCHSLARP